MRYDIEEYLQFNQQYWANKKTAYQYRLWLERFSQFVKKPLSELTLDDIQRYRKVIRERFKPKTIEYFDNIIKTFLNFNESKIAFSPRKLRVRGARADSYPAISEDEYYQLLRCAPLNYFPDVQRSLIIRILWATGIRVGELVSMNLEDLTDDYWGATIRTEKKQENRMVYWFNHPELRDLLVNKYLPIRNEIVRPSNALFLGLYADGEFSDRITSRSIQRGIKALCKRAGISKNISPHSFRHAFIVRALMIGKPDELIRQMVGHSTTLTIKHYAQLNGREVAEMWKFE